MLHPVYDIASEEIASDQWMHCRLVLEFSKHFLQYVILLEKKLVCWKYYQLPPASPAEKNAMVEAIFQTDPALQHTLKEQLLLYNFNKNCLLPASLLDINFHRPLLDMMHGDLYKGAVISEKVPGWDLYNVFGLPGGLDELCKKSFANATMRHQTSAWLACLNKQADGLYLLLSENEVGVTLLKEGKLQLVQSYPCHAFSDVVYCMLNIATQFGLDRETVPLYVAGMIAPEEALYQELFKYFALLQPVPFSADFKVSDHFGSVPAHYFSPLLKMSACV
ncbi:MAG: DUF3822 family protein [Williamsia sp.]|nr:DUF3822 family protein [Williamsia sp.]